MAGTGTQNFAQLGDIRFEVLPVIGQDAAFKAEYAEHKVVEGKPRLQWTGDALDEYTIRLRFHRSFCDPDARLKALRDAMDKHEAMTYVLGNGEVRGDFVIEEISPGFTDSFGDGSTLSMEVTIKLKEYVKDSAVTSRRSATTKRPSTSMARKSDTIATTTQTNRDNVSFQKVVRQG